MNDLNGHVVIIKRGGWRRPEPLERWKDQDRQKQLKRDGFRIANELEAAKYWHDKGKLSDAEYKKILVKNGQGEEVAEASTTKKAKTSEVPKASKDKE